MRRTCNPEKPVRILHGAPSGKSSAWFEHSTDNREAAGSPPASRTKLSMRASEPLSCWPHKPCEWRSTRQPATSFMGESFNERPAGLQPANEGFDSLLFHQVRQKGVA